MMEIIVSLDEDTVSMLRAKGLIDTTADKSAILGQMIKKHLLSLESQSTQIPKGKAKTEN